MTKALRKDTRLKKGNPGRRQDSRNKATVAVEVRLMSRPKGSHAKLLGGGSPEGPFAGIRLANSENVGEGS